MPAPLLLLLLLLQLALLPPASPYTPPYTWSFQSILTAADSNNQTSTEGLVPAHLLGRGFMSIITGRGNASALSRSAAPPPPSLPGLYVHTNDYGYAARGTNVWSQQGILIPSDLYIDHLYDSAKYPPPSLTPPPPQPPRGYGDSQFGKWMVSEGTQIIVGSPLKDAGAVYVFNGTLRHWSQTQILVPKDPDFFTNYNQDRFGEYLALEGARCVLSLFCAFCGLWVVGCGLWAGAWFMLACVSCLSCPHPASKCILLTWPRPSNIFPLFRPPSSPSLPCLPPSHVSLSILDYTLRKPRTHTNSTPDPKKTNSRGTGQGRRIRTTKISLTKYRSSLRL